MTQREFFLAKGEETTTESSKLLNNPEATTEDLKSNITNLVSYINGLEGIVANQDLELDSAKGTLEIPERTIEPEVYTLNWKLIFIFIFICFLIGEFHISSIIQFIIILIVGVSYVCWKYKKQKKSKFDRINFDEALDQSLDDIKNGRLHEIDMTKGPDHIKQQIENLIKK